MILLNEVYKNSSLDWSVREITINPRYVVKCEPDDVQSVLLAEGKMDSLGLDKRAQFTKVLLEGGLSSTVVGPVREIEKKLKQEKKLLLG